MTEPHQPLLNAQRRERHVQRILASRTQAEAVERRDYLARTEGLAEARAVWALAIERKKAAQAATNQPTQEQTP